MGLRRLISLVAMLGVLLHAGLIVRHSTIMLSAKLLHNDLVSALGVICHSDGTIKEVPASELPAVPAPSDTQSDCPICMGMIAAAAVLPSTTAMRHPADRASERVAVVGEAIAPRLAATWPPPRGPPIAI